MLKYEIAEPGNACEWKSARSRCETGKLAVHVWQNRHLCAFHSPFDFIPENVDVDELE